MASSAICDYSWTLQDRQDLLFSFEMSRVEDCPVDTEPATEVPISFSASKKEIPAPPPLPRSTFTKGRHLEKSTECSCIAKETRDVWDQLFKGGYGSDVCIVTKDQLTVTAHFSVLSVASPVFGKYLLDTKPKNCFRYLKIPGVPHGAVCTFIRFLYSSCYEEEEMKEFVLHLLVLSHCFVVPHLKRICVQYLESCWITTDNVIDVLQLARNCDAPRLSFICIRIVVRHFKSVASTEAWKVMRRANPALEQELLECVVEADSRKEERLRKREERKVYMQLNEAIEALIHICKDGCSTIGPRNKVLKGSQASCGFSACKGIEMLVRHFFSCKTRVPSGCVHCKRMWQLLELHSRMCNEPESCNVPLCRHFKEKFRQQTKKDEAKWKLLVRKVIDAKRAQNPFAAQHCSSSRSHQSLSLSLYI